MNIQFLRSSVTMLLMAVVLLPGVAWSFEAGVPVVMKANYSITNLPTEHFFTLDSEWAAARGPHGSGLAWLDNQRVMFVGVLLQQNKHEVRGLHVWDVVAGKVSQYSTHTNFCYAAGYLVAFGPWQPRNDEKRSGMSPIHYGLLGQEKDETCDTLTGKGCQGLLNMGCKPRAYINNPQPIGAKWRATFELRDGDGVLLSPTGSEEERKGKTAMLLNKHFPEGKVMPFSRVPIMGAAYSEYKRRYALTPWWPADDLGRTSSSWPKGRPQPVYLMNPEDGAVEVIPVPWRAETGTIHFALPAKNGLVYKAGGSYANDWGGLFLYDNREVWSLDRGRVETFAVSPDGCRVAYAIINDFGKIKNVRFNTIKSINFCEGGK